MLSFFKLQQGQGSNCNMADVPLSFEERKQIIKWCWKFENVAAVRRQWRRERADFISPATFVHYTVMMSFISNKMPGQWIGRRRPIEFPARSPDLTPLDFFLWDTVKDEVYKRKPHHLDTLWNEIQVVGAEISVDTLVRCTESVLTRTQQCIDPEGHQFEHYSH
ncbi:solute carrier organic anion transporter family member 2B1 X3 [Biomphalaria glabrata]|nr:solute carrier organic anion transporter family member 2B1 X3 [Biomphalaria glabrata]